ncbi:MAG: polyribonucleotide nucleotidyltransferase [Bacteroidetes bacterium]|nr:polyribonucleotide nucleotidyltransferase [Bacteroidota bacterium]
MLYKEVSKSIELSDGRKITLESGKLAKQADGSVVLKMGNTMLLATVVSSKEPKEGIDFLPLSVDYQEKFAAGGKIPGGFLKREGRLSDHEILICRLVDRAIRPLFPDDYRYETQINIQLISADHEALPDALAALSASAALWVSDIPFQGPISETRVVKLDDRFIINPNQETIDKAKLNLIVAATMDNILMVEGEMKEASEKDMLEALKFAHDAIKDQCRMQHELADAMGRTQKREHIPEEGDPELKEKLHELLYDKMYAVAGKGINVKSERSDAFKAIKQEYLDSLPEDHEFDERLINKYIAGVEKEASRNLVLNESKRLDGRKLDEIRPIWCEIDYLPSAHGSALFTRGETQSLTTLTLGTKLDEKMIDGAMGKSFQKFLLHYNFPAFSTGEVRPNRGPGRREIGHGNLAFRALKQVLPLTEENPYTIRIVSDILESNGSSSMATVCAGSLALMDSGLKITAPVSGIAMGMISDAETGKYAILSDILGDEDHLGDMDFKITGTEKGITACQMDIKVEGLSYEVLEEALEQAKRGRLHILEEMKKTIAEPRPDFKPNAPRSVQLKIEKESIGAVIGPGGKVVQEIQKETGATIIIEEVEECGLVNIFAVDKEAMEAAVNRVKAIATVPEIGEVYEGKVKSIMPFGAFVEFLPGKDGLLHISEIRWDRIEKMDGVMEVGEEIKVKLVDIDRKTGKFRLSRKVLLPKPEQKPTT